MSPPRLTLLLFLGALTAALAPARAMAQAPSGEDGASTVGEATPAEPAPRRPDEAAAAAYARGDWETAIALYRGLVAEGYNDPALFYNLGTSYARAGDKGRAVWMLLKAARLDPREASTWNNLERVAPDLGSQLAMFPLPPLEAVYRRLRLNEWALLGAGGTAVSGLACAMVLLMSPVHRRRGLVRRIAWLALGLGLAGHAMAAVKYYDEVMIVRGVVTDPETAPHAAPDGASEVYAFTLPPGTLFRIRNAGVEGWVKAVYGGRNEVFIRVGQFERI